MQETLAQITWYHNITLIEKVKKELSDKIVRIKTVDGIELKIFLNIR